ncbi:hypothetical protein ACQKWADRAFT_300530 [Trichoderma austrokoningii]
MAFLLFSSTALFILLFQILFLTRHRLAGPSSRVSCLSINRQRSSSFLIKFCSRASPVLICCFGTGSWQSPRRICSNKL